ncbi:hypothetical protein ALO98_200194 [Pseudomonas syringae pv. tagetis]|nr:hypothetical protein ALO98_200194 [Pseudomonas syringae pv. tagetis]
MGAAPWLFAFLAVTNLFNLCQVPAEVVAETAGQVVDALFFDQAVRVVVGEVVGSVVFVGEGDKTNGFVVLVGDGLPFGILSPFGQAAAIAQQLGGLAFAVGVGQDLAQFVIGKGLAGAIRVIDAQHFAVGLAFQRGGVVQGIGDGHQMVALVIAVIRAFARTILKALHLRQGVPPQVFGLERRVDDGMRQAVLAIEVFGHVAQCVNLGHQITLGVVAGLPDAAVGVIDLSDQRGQVVVLITNATAQRIGFLEQPGELVVLEGQLIAIGQRQAGHVAGVVDLDDVVIAAVVAARGDAMILVVMNFQLAAQ